ncbi:MAG: hypothetical protein IH851_08545 [Armatimonadetes bacterium]|nr:hypothetical protein [Armatimonadota bacterium]
MKFYPKSWRETWLEEHKQDVPHFDAVRGLRGSQEHFRLARKIEGIGLTVDIPAGASVELQLKGGWKVTVTDADGNARDATAEFPFEKVFALLDTQSAVVITLQMLQEYLDGLDGLLRDLEQPNSSGSV